MLVSRDVKPGRSLSNDSSTQWAADYMAFTFSNLLKAGAVHRPKTFAVLYVVMEWILSFPSLFFSIYPPTSVSLDGQNCFSCRDMADFLNLRPIYYITPQPAPIRGKICKALAKTSHPFSHASIFYLFFLFSPIAGIYLPSDTHFVS